MAPKKFGIFKGKSREQQEQPSTENLLQSSCSDLVVQHPPSPIPSTSRGYSNENGYAEFAMLRLDSDDEDNEDDVEVNCLPRRIALAKAEEAKYVALASTSGSSVGLDGQDLQTIKRLNRHIELQDFADDSELATADDATSVDAESLQFDPSPVVSEDVMRYRENKKIKKRQKNRDHQEFSDQEMFNVDDSVVMHRLLQRNCSINELLKWEAIAMLRGICTLTTNCTCQDCKAHQSQVAQLGDGDAGLASAPLMTVLSMGCQLQ